MHFIIFLQDYLYNSSSMIKNVSNQTMDMDYTAIGSRIRNARKKVRMSQERLAEKAGISITHMSHVETGTTKVSLPTLICIANALHVSLDGLVCDSIVESRAIYANEIADIVDACNENQLRIITDVLKATKLSLDKNLY